MKPVRPCVGIFYAPKRRAFLVFTMGMGSSGQTLINQPVELTDQEFDARIEVALIEALNCYQTKAAGDQVWRSPEGMRNFIRNHLRVRVERLESGDLKVFPLHHESGGYVGKKGEDIIVPAADVPTKIVSVLRDAFSVAS